MGISYYYTFEILWASHVLLVGKNLPANQETYEMQVRFMDWEDPLEEGIAIHSNILAWRIPQTEEPGSLQSIGSHRIKHK